MAGNTNQFANEMPKLDSPLIDASGRISMPWYRLMIALWNRTGYAPGIFTPNLDAFGSQQGDLLFRGPTVWEALSPGTAGQFLITGGSGADPHWGTAITEINTGQGLQGGPINTVGTIELAEAPADTLKGNNTPGNAIPTDLVVSDVKAMLNYVASGDLAGGDLTGSYPSPSIALNAVTNAKLAQAPANTLKGNNTAALANEQDLTVAQVQAMLGGLPPTGAAGGDLAGTYPNPTLRAAAVNALILAYFQALPTSLPGTPNQPWNNHGVVSIS